MPSVCVDFLTFIPSHLQEVSWLFYTWTSIKDVEDGDAVVFSDVLQSNHYQAGVLRNRDTSFNQGLQAIVPATEESLLTSLFNKVLLALCSHIDQGLVGCD